MSNEILSLAYYLPQFHEIEENNIWWGKGFTEWANLRESQLYFPWQQIRRPIAPYGEYNLLNPDVLEWQSRLARSYGINGMMVFDYWFGNGKTLLEKPMQLALEKQLDFDYCFCWANHSWFNKKDNILLMQQHYLGVEDYTAYFYRLLPHFRSSHYLKVGAKPIFGIFNPKEIPDIAVFVEVFQSLAAKEGLGALYLIAENTDGSADYAKYFDRYGKSSSYFKGRRRSSLRSYLKEKLTRKFNFQQLGPFVYDYSAMMQFQPVADDKNIPVVFTGWDTSPRHKRRGTILSGFDQFSFRQHLAQIGQSLEGCQQEKIVLIKSWNEWAEGNLLEPDDVFGYAMLEEYKAFLDTMQQQPK